MWKPEGEPGPYSIKAACAADRAKGTSHMFVDVGRDSIGCAVPSLERLKRKVNKCMVTDKKAMFAATKLYIVGDWNLAEPNGGQNKRQKTLVDVQEWKDGVDEICKLITYMGNLKELIWTSGLPFMASIFNVLPTKLTKLVLDLGNLNSVKDDGVSLWMLHIKPKDMEPLMKQTRLLELRLLRLRDSLQSIAWKTVFLNEVPGGMRILELQMDAMPIVHNIEWHKASYVHGLTVPLPGLLEKPYKGINGTGSIHWRFGYGEYLDGDCIRKARIASGVEEAVPLPLQCLKLDGFVIDHLPFEHELSYLRLLTCDEKCIDAGVRAPKTHAEPYHAWSKKVSNAACGFLIQWPDWSGMFDTEGDQRDKHGAVVAQDVGMSTPYAECTPSLPQHLPLTERTLNMKDIGDPLNTSKPNYFNIPPTLRPLSVPDTPLGAMSSLSERGFEVPTPTGTSTATTNDEIPAVDGSLTSGSDSAASSYISHINGASGSTPEVSPISSSCNSNFEECDGPPRKHEVKKSLCDNYWVLGPS